MAFQQEQFIISPSLNALLNIYKSSTQLIFSIIIFVIYNHPPIENIVSKKEYAFYAKNWGFLCAQNCVLLFNHLYE